MKSIVILGINGGFGRLFLKNLLPEDCEIIGVDLAAEKPADLPDSVNYIGCDLSEDVSPITSIISTCDYLFAFLPEKILYNFIPTIHPHLSPDTLVIDSISSKNIIFQLYDTYKINAISINPLFRSDLPTLDQNILIVEGDICFHQEFILALFKKMGLNLFHISIDQHEEITSLLQVATHMSILSFFLLLKKSNQDIKQLIKLSSPPFFALVSLFARIHGGNPDIYWDIQRDNKFGVQAREKLLESFKELDSIINNNDKEAFDKIFQFPNYENDPFLNNTEEYSRDIFNMVNDYK